MKYTITRKRLLLATSAYIFGILLSFAVGIVNAHSTFDAVFWCASTVLLLMFTAFEKAD